MHTFTYIDLEDDSGEFAKSCNDCGAHVITKNEPSDDLVVHHPSCAPGESARWQKHYEENS